MKVWVILLRNNDHKTIQADKSTFVPPTTTFMLLNILVIRGKQEELPVYLSDYQFAPFLCLQNVGPNENEVLKSDHYCVQS